MVRESHSDQDDTTSDHKERGAKKVWTRPVITAVNIKSITQGLGRRSGDSGLGGRRRS